MKTTKKSRPMKIHLAVDGSENSFAAARLVRDFPLHPDSEITALGVLTPRHAPSQYLLLAALDEVQKILEQSGAKVNTGLLHGNPAAALGNFDAVHPPELIVIGAKGLRSTLGILLGGVAQQIVEHAHKPVLVVRVPNSGLKRVLVVVDGSKYSEHSLRFFKRFPLPVGSEVLVIHVLPSLAQEEYLSPESRYPTQGYIPPPTPKEVELELSRQAEIEESVGRDILNHAVESLQAAGMSVSSAILRGDAASEILDYAKAHEVDLIVAGGRGLGAVKGWLLGSVSRKLVHYAHCSVLIDKGL